MVLHALPHTRQVVERFDAYGSQMFGGPNAGQHEQLGRCDGAGAEDDLIAVQHE